ncbi:MULTISPECIES: hypothetical protein [unclassified Imperialibacter]|uniref:hypothetical protein n=1 Tax=unclassified Imperialibacter TaxID=2629706 RepID=UPI0012559C98|nr:MULTISPECIES: hypothetical protein [unclassified Imperialibacter]CAD5276720.1 conserved membrane hypothetical protein [Imperialibacter sp. 89]CAD5295089.1 conserved membrane hypothetical protein [Imperialibacter sp. 75]VVT29043.1 conserved membrane hypothetical protein [Imperialibacter sp. EC-SDR9]
MAFTLFEWLQKPFYQLQVFVVLTFVFLVIMRPVKADNAWMIAGIVYGCFIVVNTVLIGFADKPWYYFLTSLGFSILYLIAIGVLIPALIRVMKMEGSGESAMVFLLIIYHPLALMLMMFLKWAYFKVF